MSEPETEPTPEPVQAPEPTPEPTKPVEAAPQVPQTTLGEVTTRQAVEVVDLDSRFAEARKSIESDEFASEADKKLKLLQLDVMYEDRRDRQHRSNQSAEEDARNGYVKKYGSTRETVDSTWNDAVSESIRRRGKFDYGTALTVFENKMDAAKKQPEAAPIPEKKPVGQTRTEPRGARQAPVQPEKKMTVQEMLDRATMGDYSAIPADVLAEAKR